MPFVDFSSAFNTISPMKLIGKPHTLGLSTTLRNWILVQTLCALLVRKSDSHTSSTLVLNPGAPQGSVLSPFLFTLHTHDCTARHQVNATVSMWTTPPSAATLWTTVRDHIGRKSTILQSGSQKTIGYSASAEPRNQLLILTNTPCSTIVEAEVEQVNS